MSAGVRVAPDGSLNYLYDPPKTVGIYVRKAPELIAVDIEDAEDRTVVIKYRDDDLRACGRAASDMAGKSVDIFDDHRLACRIRMAADPFIEIDPRAGERPLEG